MTVSSSGKQRGGCSKVKAPNASIISRQLREAGLPKASTYSVYGRTAEGFQVIKGWSADGTVTIWATSDHRPEELIARVVEVLTALGYVLKDGEQRRKFVTVLGLDGEYSSDIFKRRD